MKINKTIVIAVLLFSLLMGGLAAGVLVSQMPLNASAAPPAQEGNDADEVGDVVDDDGNEANETEEANISPDQTGITADEAKTAAEKAYAGAKAVAVELERENGQVIYEVELDNGLEVIVDAGNGDVLGTE